MSRPLWILLAVVGLMWTGLCWLGGMLLSSSGRAVATVTRWFGYPPSSTQWLSDTLASLGSAAAMVVALFWVIGLVALILFGRFLSRLSAETRRAVEQAREQRGYAPGGGDPGGGDPGGGDPRGGDIVEGEIRDRTIQATDGSRIL